MPATKTIVASIAIGYACPETSEPALDKNEKPVPGKFSTVVLKHAPAGKSVTIAADEADALIARGVAKEATKAALAEAPVSAAPVVAKV